MLPIAVMLLAVVRTRADPLSVPSNTTSPVTDNEGVCVRLCEGVNDVVCDSVEACVCVSELDTDCEDVPDELGVTVTELVCDGVLETLDDWVWLALCVVDGVNVLDIERVMESVCDWEEVCNDDVDCV